MKRIPLNVQTMIQRVYIDTSVFGGYFDEEFAHHTIPLFERLRNHEFTLLYSVVTQDELENAPVNVRDLVKTLRSEWTEYLDVTDDAIELAIEYIAQKVVGQTSYADCLHIALATVHKADFLISWNFKHSVNVERIRGYNAINMKNGYKQLEIRSPREFEKYEDD
jgi:predicted nucleic acid-binding protein